MARPDFVPPPYPPEFDTATLARSIAELDGFAIEKGAYGMGSTAWLARALVSSLRDLGPAELRRLLAHGRGVRWVLPLALTRLEREPFLAGDYGPGDVLRAVLSLGPDDPAWTEERRAQLDRILAGGRSTVAVLPEPERTRILEDLDVADELFPPRSDPR
ncbi:MAG TPA: contact-dependent growth inhibition system immunity protein [Gemmatirosa sp.]